jgi:predicted nucleic acid-binding protein
MRALDRGDRFVVTRRGVPVAELTPVARRARVSAAAVLDAFAGPDPRPAPEIRPGPGLLDTSILLEPFAAACLPSVASISALSLAELAAAPHAAPDPGERALRQQRLQVLEATFDPLPVDASCARAYGRLNPVIAHGGESRGRTGVHLLTAATAMANGLALYTREARELRGLEPLLEVVDAGRDRDRVRSHGR